MSHRLEALACAALLTLAACGSSGQEAGELSALAERDQGPDHGQSAAPGAPRLGGRPRDRLR